MKKFLQNRVISACFSVHFSSYSFYFFKKMYNILAILLYCIIILNFSLLVPDLHMLIVIKCHWEWLKRKEVKAKKGWMNACVWWNCCYVSATCLLRLFYKIYMSVGLLHHYEMQKVKSKQYSRIICERIFVYNEM